MLKWCVLRESNSDYGIRRPESYPLNEGRINGQVAGIQTLIPGFTGQYFNRLSYAPDEMEVLVGIGPTPMLYESIVPPKTPKNQNGSTGRNRTDYLGITKPALRQQSLGRVVVGVGFKPTHGAHLARSGV